MNDATYYTHKYNLLGIRDYDDLLRLLQEGYKLCSVEEMSDGTKWIQTRISADRNYIRWNNHGSSAHDATTRDLHFIVTEIFESSIDQIIRDYIFV